MSPTLPHRIRPLAILTALTLAATGCGASEVSSADGELSVAAGFYPLAWVAERVAGDHAVVHNLTRPGKDAHDSDMTLADTARLSDASLVIISRGFQPGIDNSADQNATGPVLDAAALLEFQPVGGGDHDEHGHGEDEDHGEHDHGDLDPHFWLDPLLMADLGHAVAAELADLAPEHADDFTAAADGLRADLEALDTAYADGLANCEHTTVVVSHDAFGYLRKYGLEFEPIAGLSPGAEPTPADLQRLHRIIDAEGITTVFNETLAPTTLGEQVARDRGIGTDVLDPVEGLTSDTADEDYLSLMEKNLVALKRANRC